MTVRQKVRALLAWGIHSTVLLTGEQVVELAPLLVEGRHFDEVALSLPLGVTRIEREELERSGARSVPEVLERLAGVRLIDTTGNGANGQVSMRGFGDNSGLRALIIVDGQVYNPPDMGSINWLGIDLAQLETVEVLRGGQTVLYGNHAVSGVIKLTTRRIDESGEGIMAVGVGSDEDYHFRAGVSGMAGELGIRVSTGWRQLQGYRDHSALTSRTLQLKGEQKFKKGSRWTGGLSYTRSAMELPGPLSYESMLSNPRGAVAGLGDVAGETLQLTQYGEGTTGWGGWELAAGYLERDGEWNLSGLYADNQLDRFTLNPRAKITLGKGYFIGGVDIFLDKVSHTGFLDRDRDITVSVADLQRATAGGYLFHSREMGNGLQLSGGIRMESAGTDNRNDHFMESQLLAEFETNRGTVSNPYYKNPPDLDPDLSFEGSIEKSGWSGEISLLWKAGESTAVWGGWDRVYRYPALDEAASYQGYPLSDPLNEGLDPETGNNFEVGFKHSGQNWQASLAVFYLRLDDEISFVEYENESGTGFVRLNDNIGDSTRWGMETWVSFQSGNYGWSILFNWNDASLAAGTGKIGKLPLVPEYETGLIAWIKPGDSLRLQFFGRYLDDQVQGNDFSMGNLRIPGYFLAHVTMHWDVNDNLDVIAGINNLFNKVHAASAYAGGFYPGAGRQAFLTLHLEF